MKSKQKKINNFIDLDHRKEIFYNIVNASLAGMLVFLGACLNGGFDLKSIFLGLITGLIAAAVKFKDYWDGEKTEYSTKLINFI
jgi:hypothetical protein